MNESRGFTPTQVEQLLKPVHMSRVMRDGKGHAHLSQQDVTAHLIRVFGFGNFDTEVISVECIFEHNRLTSDGKLSARWDVGYRALVRLTVRNPDGVRVCSYENGSTATAQNQSLGDAHDLAFKSAISLALKRCAINLGDQFGLSLYNKGQMAPLVIGTLAGVVDSDDDDIQAGVPEQVTDGEWAGDDTDGPAIGAGGLASLLAKQSVVASTPESL